MVVAASECLQPHDSVNATLKRILGHFERQFLVEDALRLADSAQDRRIAD
jgi:hypothetical protein